MITDVLIFVLGGFVQVVAFLFSAIGFLVPSQFQTAIAQYVSYFSYAQGILPVVATPGMSGFAGSMGLLTILGWGLQFIAAWYLLKLVLFVFGLIPWLGKNVSLHF